MAIFDKGPLQISDYVNDINRLILNLNAANLTNIPLMRAPQGASEMRQALNNVIKNVNAATTTTIPYFSGPQDVSSFLSLLNILGLLGAQGPAFTTGLTKANTASFRALVKANTRNVRAACIGDSTVRGQSTGVGTAQAVNAWPMQLAPLLRAAGINAGANNCYADGGSWGLAQTAANFVTGDGRMAITGGWAQGSVQSPGGNAFASSAIGAMTFTPQDQVDTLEIDWRDGATGRNMDLTDNIGGAVTHILSSNIFQLGQTIISLASLASHSLALSWVLGTVTPIAFYAYNSAAGKEISLLNWGICGATSSQMISNNDAAVGRLPLIANPLTSPDLSLIEGAVINDWRTSVPINGVNGSQANLTTLLTNCLAVGNVIVCIPVFDNGSAGFTSNQQAYVDMMYAVAASFGVGVFDIRKKWLSYANAVANGWQSAGDSVHPTTAGYADIAAQMVPVIQYALTA